MQAKTSKDLISSFNYFKRKMVVHDAWRYIQRTAWTVASIISALLLIARIWPIKHIDLISLGILGAWVLSIGIYILLVPRTPKTVAWRVDQELDLKERFSSSIVFSEFENVDNKITRMLLVHQRSSTITALNQVDPKLAFKLTLTLPTLIRTLVITSIAILLYALPNPMDQIIRQREETAAAAEEQAEKIDELIEEVQTTDELSPEEKEMLLRELESLAEQLRENQGDLSEALADLSRTEQALLERLDPQLDFKRTALNSITQQLADLASVDPNEMDLSEDFDELLETLLNQLPEMDQAELQQLAQSLQKLAAQAAQAGEGSLAQALSALSQSAQSSNSQTSSQDAESVSQALSQAQSDLANQQNLESILAQLQASKTAMSQSGQPGGSNPSQAQGNQPGQGQNPGQGQTSGNGQSQGQGNSAAGGGGTQADTLPDSTGSGQAIDPTGTGQSGSTGTLDDQVYAPWERQNASENELSISGQETDQGQSEVKEQNLPLPGALSPSRIPYTEVFASYQNTAYETLENSYIPIGLKEYVLKYFSLLEP